MISPYELATYYRSETSHILAVYHRVVELNLQNPNRGDLISHRSVLS